MQLSYCRLIIGLMNGHQFTIKNNVIRVEMSRSSFRSFTWIALPDGTR